jgi:vacuolar-type H+-ATPase subunit E/Vma4
MDMEKDSKKNFGEPADVMLLLAKEAEDVVVDAGKSARQEAEEETEKLLRQYEQRARQIVLKIREESRVRAEEMAVRFRDALILRVEEASTVAMDETIKSVGVRTGEIIKHLQDTVRKETRQALAEGLVAGDEKPASMHVPVAEQTHKPVPDLVRVEDAKTTDEGANPVPESPEEFEKWLMQ